ncbi:hypothetical protein [Rheinheimera oceanensis]|uniref:hypothetical protein n=1 Tax=Rheinheimera oceanensis TaxID=2817449 RepID=UPI001BFECAFC|nr:hypothetical protein [Rheinheimera oceanensis]
MFYSRSICFGITLLLTATSLQASNGWHGPEPFRLERLDGRQFDYNIESFLQRLSFTEQPIQTASPLWQQNGWYGTGGSSRGREFYVHSLMQQKLSFDAPVFAGFRHKRSEDLDGRYDRTLFGIGYQAEQQWELGVWGDISGAKEEMDLQFEAHRAYDDGSYATAAVVLADVFYNSKTYSDNRYEQSPVTLYLAGAKMLGQQQLAGFVNLNLTTRYADEPARQLFTDKQYSVGVNWQRELLQGARVLVQAHGLYGRRSAGALLTEPQSADWLLVRRFQQLNAEWQQAPAANSFNFGLQANRLTEQDSRASLERTAAEYRREAFAYVRTERPISENWLWRPTLYTGYANVTSELRQHSDEPLKDNGWLAKVSPNVVWQLSELTGAYLTINPTVKLHNLQFGGGNVQVFVPF